MKYRGRDCHFLDLRAHPQGASLGIALHPNFRKVDGSDNCRYVVGAERLLSWRKRLHGIEIYTSRTHRDDRFDGAVAISEWDWLLGQGFYLRGFADDDSNGRLQRGAEIVSDTGYAWNEVWVQANTPGAIWNSMALGFFYAAIGGSVPGRGIGVLSYPWGDLEIDEILTHELSPKYEKASSVWVTVGRPGKRMDFRVGDTHGRINRGELSQDGWHYYRFWCKGPSGSLAFLQPVPLKTFRRRDDFG